jgi:peptide deformylase
MSGLKDSIITLPNKHLREKSRRIAVVTDEVRAVINKMKEATLDWEASRKHEVGVALAAIQIDEPLRIIVVRNNFDDKDDHRFNVFINPEITKTEGQIEEDYEGCLSVLDVYGKIPRYNNIRLRALDENGNSVRVKAKGFLARVLQHEIDHLNGKLFVDYIENSPEAFYRITEDGKLEKLPYEQVKQMGIFSE